MAICSSCNALFTCGMRESSEPCWCAALPPLQTIEPGKDCLCPECFGARSSAEPGNASPAAEPHER
jgi:hypothetical protein